MRAWAPLWLFPVGVLGMLALFSLSFPAGPLLALAWGFVLFPHGTRYLLAHWRAGRAEGSLPEVETHYWRTTLR